MLTSTNIGPKYGFVNTEVNTYVRNARLVGGVFQPYELHALDTFVTTLRQVDIWRKLEEVGIFLGGFKSAFTKLKYRTDAGAYCINNGFLPNDYVPKLGLQGGGTKYISTKFRFSNTLIKPTNISVGAFTTSTDGNAVGAVMGNNYVNGSNNGLYVGYTNAFAQLPVSQTGLRITQGSSGPGLVSFTGTTTGSFTYMGSQQYGSNIAPSGTALASLLNIFYFSFSSTTAYYQGSISGYYIGTYLTASEISTLSTAFSTLNNTLGRIPYIKNIYCGDSITGGLKASDPLKRWAVVANSSFNNGGTAIISGMQGTLLQNSVNVQDNFHDTYQARALSYLNPEASTVWILYGMNDMLYNDVSLSSTQFATQLSDVLTGLIAGGVPAANIRVGTIPYIKSAGYTSGTAPYNTGSNTKHLDYNSKIQTTVASFSGVKFADVYTYMLNNGGDSLISSDNIHPNDSGHAAIATAMCAAA
jgi:lysophospholipase L1-like esterase